MRDRVKNCIICGRFIPNKNYKYCYDCHEHYNEFKNKLEYTREEFEYWNPDGTKSYKHIFYTRKDKIRRIQNENK
jgi:hypothetical protein